MRRSGDYLECVSDHEFHVRAVACPDLELREESSAVLSAHEDVESSFDLGVVTPSTVTVVVEAHDVQRGTGSDIDRPRIVVERNLVGKLQIKRDEDSVTAHPDFGVRAKDKPIQEGGGFEMPTEKELVRVPADANPDADVFLCRTRTRERENENGCASEGRIVSGRSFFFTVEREADRPTRSIVFVVSRIRYRDWWPFDRHADICAMILPNDVVASCLGHNDLVAVPPVPN